MYVILLLAFLVIGYLYGKVESSPTGSTSNAASNTLQPTQAVPQAPTAPDPKTVLSKLKPGHLPLEGQENAKVTIVEFSDFECPFCGRFFQDTLPQIRKDYIETGKVKLYYRHLPLDFHPQAKPLAIASECANDQGKFWEMHDKIFENSATISTSNVETQKQWAAELGLNTATFNNCVDAGQHTDLIDEDKIAAGEVGASGTPTFYINGQQLVGALPFASFKAVIDTELAK